VLHPHGGRDRRVLAPNSQVLGGPSVICTLTAVLTVQFVACGTETAGLGFRFPFLFQALAPGGITRNNSAKEAKCVGVAVSAGESRSAGSQVTGIKGKGGRPGVVSNEIAWACRTACAVRVILFGNETGNLCRRSGSGLGPIEDKNQ
jgi:hypothetical protein